MLWTIIVILLVLWMLGFLFEIAGGIIHLLLVIALIVLVFNFITGKNRTKK
ncbi:lmo0937 family membrane protein [Evansella halocellulosilytica]|uniref:lmo0937 family membrane protein n=1 Tax=Evansella halocellulosilytica TaxID=2011013 RepID=UPI001155E082|nr:lmo0937 family membrane protein [Evansella halocellulosilytica]